jgi:8-oxo-dGTP pyrophosphatase MutT (NUDIX family)
MLLDRTGPVPKVLLGQRHQGHVFMPGLYVFPGGKVEAADSRVPASGRLPAHVERRLRVCSPRSTPARAKAYALAAIRERSFAECGVTPTLDDIWLVARSITPTGLSRRYDTRFFAADADRICHELDGVVHPEAELVDVRWVAIGDSLDLSLHRITRLVLEELAARLKMGIERDLPVPFFRPRRGIMQRFEI